MAVLYHGARELEEDFPGIVIVLEEPRQTTEDLIRDAYDLEFTGLSERPEYTHFFLLQSPPFRRTIALLFAMGGTNVQFAVGRVPLSGHREHPRPVRPPTRHPRCIVVAGPNGAGKTTFACDDNSGDTPRLLEQAP